MPLPISFTVGAPSGGDSRKNLGIQAMVSHVVISRSTPVFGVNPPVFLKIIGRKADMASPYFLSGRGAKWRTNRRIFSAPLLPSSPVQRAIHGRNARFFCCPRMPLFAAEPQNSQLVIENSEIQPQSSHMTLFGCGRRAALVSTPFYLRSAVEWSGFPADFLMSASRSATSPAAPASRALRRSRACCGGSPGHGRTWCVAGRAGPPGCPAPGASDP